MKMDMEAIKDVFVTPMSVFLGITGIVIDTVSLFTGTGSVGSWAFATGVMLMGSSLAIGATRFFTMNETLALARLEREKQKKRDEELVKLNNLSSKLRLVPNKTAREHFKDLINIKKSFEETIEQDDIRSRMPRQFDASFLELFWSAIRKLDHASRLYTTASGMTNKKTIVASATKVIDEVGEDLIALTQVFEGLTEMALIQDDGQDGLREDLQSKLSTQIATNRELKGFNSDLDNRMKEYL
jgi:hypothetical protein